MATSPELAGRVAELLLSRDPDTVAQGIFLLDDANLRDADVIDALIGPALFERFSDPARVPPVPLSLWERLPGLSVALRAATLPDSAFFSSPLAPLYEDAFPDVPGEPPYTVLDRAAWDEAEALRARLGLPLPFARLIRYDDGRTGLGALKAPYDALRSAFPETWARRLRGWMAACVSRASGADAVPMLLQVWLDTPDEDLTIEAVLDGGRLCAELAAARAASSEDASFGGAAAAHRQIEGSRQEGLLWALLSDGAHRWPLSVEILSQRDGFDELDWVKEPAVALWAASPRHWRRGLRLWACDCAGHVLGTYGLRSREDERPRRALAATRALLAGEGSRGAWEAACAEAERAKIEADAAYQRVSVTRPGDARYADDLYAAWQAARGILLAARGHALEAARACEHAAESASWAPAIDEIDWQRERLRAYLQLP